MAAKFVVAVALFALCHANPVLINGVLYRDGRAYASGQAYNYGGGVSRAQANVNRDAAQAYSSSSGDALLARDGYFYTGPAQAIAQAQTYDAPENLADGTTRAVAQAQNGPYYPVPAPATVITYEQNFAGPTKPTYVAYENPNAITAQSSAVSNGASDSSVSSASSNGAGAAESSAKTQGSYGTSSNAKTYGSGSGSADSSANSGYGSTRTSANSYGQGFASSDAQTGVVGVVYPVAPATFPEEVPSAVIDAKTPIFHTVYVPNVPAQSASSNAKVIGSGNAASSAKATHGRTISWRFGTAYDAPASAHAQAQTHAGYGAAKSDAHTHGYGSANANADINGYGAANSIADTHSGHGIAKSAAHTHGYGSANANADVNGYGFANSIADTHSGHGIAKSSANANGAGSANANADVSAAGYGAARSAANTQNGSAASSANTNTGYGAAKSTADVHGAYYGGSRTSAEAHNHGFGNAASSARTQGVNSAFTSALTNSQANSPGYGSAHANALAI